MEQEQKVEEAETVEVEVADPSIDEQKSQEVEVVQEKEQTETKPEQKEDELESYSKNVQTRIKKLTEKYRKEERRSCSPFSTSP